jgi:hypothetical protein
MLAIRDAGLPQPGGWCISPWVDMEATGETMVSKSTVDPTVQKAGILVPLPTRGELCSAGGETGRIFGVHLRCRSWAKLV